MDALMRPRMRFLPSRRQLTDSTGGSGAGRRGRETRPPERSSSPTPRGAFPTDGDRALGADAPGAPCPGRPRPSPRRAPGAQVWPGPQVQSAQRRARFPPGPPRSAALPAYLRVQRGHRHGRGSRAARGRGGRSSGGPAVEAPGGYRAGRRVSSAGPSCGRSFPAAPRTFPSAGGRGGWRRRLVPRPSLASPRRDWLGRGGGGARPSSGESRRRSASTWRAERAARKPAERDARGSTLCAPRLPGPVQPLTAQRVRWEEQGDVTGSTENPSGATNDWNV